ADFLAGWLSRRSDYARVGLLSQLAAAAGSILVSAAVGGHPSGASLWWGALSGLGGGLGTLALYRGLGRGRMDVVAPLAGGPPGAFRVRAGRAARPRRDGRARARAPGGLADRTCRGDRGSRRRTIHRHPGRRARRPGLRGAVHRPTAGSA